MRVFTVLLYYSYSYCIDWYANIIILWIILIFDLWHLYAQK